MHVGDGFSLRKSRPKDRSYGHFAAIFSQLIGDALNRIAPPNLIKKMFQLNPKRRRSGMDRRNLGFMDGGVWGIPAIWIPAVHAGMTE